MQGTLKAPKGHGRMAFAVDGTGQQVPMDRFVQAERTMLCEVIHFTLVLPWIYLLKFITSSRCPISHLQCLAPRRHLAGHK